MCFLIHWRGYLAKRKRHRLNDNSKNGIITIFFVCSLKTELSQKDYDQ